MSYLGIKRRLVVGAGREGCVVEREPGLTLKGGLIC